MTVLTSKRYSTASQPSAGSLYHTVTYHVHCFRVNGFRDDAPLGGHELHHLVQRRPLHLLPLQIWQRIRDEVEQDAALPYLLHEQFVALVRCRVCSENITPCGNYITLRYRLGTVMGNSSLLTDPYWLPAVNTTFTRCAGIQLLAVLVLPSAQPLTNQITTAMQTVKPILPIIKLPVSWQIINICQAQQFYCI